MKMNFFFGPVFWGVLLLLWGVSLILKGFNIVDLPLVKIFFAVIIIMFGVRLLLGSWNRDKVQRFHGSVVTAGNDEYTSVFASQTIDLTNLDPDSGPLEITAVFGSAYVMLPDDIEFHIQSTNVFGSSPGPARPATGKPSLGKVNIEATAVFGKVEFVYKPAKRANPAPQPDSATGGNSD